MFVPVTGVDCAPSLPSFSAIPVANCSRLERVERAWGAIGAGEDTAFAPLLPKLIEVLRGGTAGGIRVVRDVGAEYVLKMRERLPEVCPACSLTDDSSLTRFAQ